jgi:hypothetical protein
MHCSRYPSRSNCFQNTDCPYQCLKPCMTTGNGEARRTACYNTSGKGPMKFNGELLISYPPLSLSLIFPVLFTHSFQHEQNKNQPCVISTFSPPIFTSKSCLYVTALVTQYILQSIVIPEIH